MVRTGTRRPVVGVVAGTLLRDRAVLMADGVPMRGREFPPTGSGVPAAAPLIIPSQIGEVPMGGGVIRSRSVLAQLSQSRQSRSPVFRSAEG
jgi:hypothetical protein